MRWCARCVLPDTRPNLTIGPDGVCDACRTHEAKGSIDWAARAAAFREVVEKARRRSRGYDCVVPVSGGKDSHWQVATCLDHGLRVLAVSWRPPGRTELGRRNLENLIRMGVDHMDWSIDPDVERRFALRTFEERGSPAIPMHLAIHAVPLAVAVRFRIPLVVWGENSAFEYGGPEDAKTGFRLDAAWLRRYGISGGTTARDWISADLTARDLAPYMGPTPEEAEAAGTQAVFLGWYFRWDPAETYRVARAHGFEARAEGPLTGLYHFADIDDLYLPIHHWMKWYKFGFTRLFDNLSLEIRNGRMTREEAIGVIRARGEERPDSSIEAFCAWTGIDRDRFFEIAERFRNPAVWTRRGDRWEIPGFLVPDWRWT